MERKKILIVGGGPAGLMAADVLSPYHEVHLFEKGKNVGRKFLVAGKGGFNLTNSVRGEQLLSKYSPSGFLDNALSDFDTQSTQEWLSKLGIPTFIGTSGRVFPEKGTKPNDILKKIKAKLINQGVQFQMEHEFVGFDNNKQVRFKFQEKEIVQKADYIIFALGGASWPITGSTGSWLSIFNSMNVDVKSFQSSNCGINIPWTQSIIENHSGKPFKNIRLFTDDFEVRGEAVLTEYGLEGNVVYPIVPQIRNMLNSNNEAFVYMDLKPLNTEEQLLQKINGRKISSKDYAKNFNLNTAQLAVIKSFTSKECYLSPEKFISSIKKLKIPVDSLRPIEEAISSVGGIKLIEVNKDFSLRKYPWIYTIGEMLDWDAPTGGFLLQGSFSMGQFAANSILKII
jgi:hypothetical protein